MTELSEMSVKDILVSEVCQELQEVSEAAVKIKKTLQIALFSLC